MRRLRAWGTLGLSLVALAPHPCPADVSRLSPKPLSVWRDEGGREIAKLISPRLLFLYTWDSSGRVVHIEAFTGSFDPQSRTIPPRGEPLWKHLFLYGEGGNLIGEQDCRGEFHPLDPKGRFQVDPDRGTALRGHRHGAVGRSVPSSQPLHQPRGDEGPMTIPKESPNEEPRDDR